MPEIRPIQVAIVDYGLGNLYSVMHACAWAGLHSVITSSKEEILNADAVVLPGVGAFGDAMETLRKLDLIGVLCEIAELSKPLIGICLGAQLLMSESYEFGWYQGLGIIEGSVVRLDNPKEGDRTLKVPHVGWNRICKTASHVDQAGNDPWSCSLLNGLEDGDYMYFIHSYIIKPNDSNVTLSTSLYGHIEFCSSLQHQNIFACQFHPERSGARGLDVYYNLALCVHQSRQRES